jgi:prepilin peptidase CpaA
LILFLPLYLLRAMGAGDVKLMAALGSFVGPVETVNLALSIFAVGGVIALARMAWRRNSHIVFRNVSLALRGMSVGTVRAFDPLTQSADHMPYALAFAGGLLVYGYWRLSGGAPLISF